MRSEEEVRAQLADITKRLESGALKRQYQVLWATNQQAVLRWVLGEAEEVSG